MTTVSVKPIYKGGLKAAPFIESGLIFFGEFVQLGQGENRSVLADVLAPDFCLLFFPSFFCVFFRICKLSVNSALIIMTPSVGRYVRRKDQPRRAEPRRRVPPSSSARSTDMDGNQAGTYSPGFQPSNPERGSKNWR